MFIKGEYLIKKEDMNSSWLVSSEAAILAIEVLLIDKEDGFERTEDPVTIEWNHRRLFHIRSG